MNFDENHPPHEGNGENEFDEPIMAINNELGKQAAKDAKKPSKGDVFSLGDMDDIEYKPGKNTQD